MSDARPVSRLIFMGTPQASVPALAALVAAGFDIPLVVSNPDKRRGRGSKLDPSPVKQAALEFGIEVTDDLNDIDQVEAELAVVVAYGHIIPTLMLERLAMVNIHFSLLPAWRGAAPVERALLAGDTKTGVCLMEIVPELDAGAVYARRELEIEPTSTAASLRLELAALGAELLVEELNRGLIDPMPQTGEISYAAKIKIGDLELNFAGPAEYLDRQIRVGGAWTTFRGQRFRIHTASITEESTYAFPGTIESGATIATGRGRLQLATVQVEGKTRVAAADWVNGARIEPGEKLGT